MSNLPTTNPMPSARAACSRGNAAVEKVMGWGGMGVVVAARHVSMGHRSR